MRYLAVSRRWLSDYGLGDGTNHRRSHVEIFPEIPDRCNHLPSRLEGEVVQADEDRFERPTAPSSATLEMRPWPAADGPQAHRPLY